MRSQKIEFRFTSTEIIDFEHPYEGFSSRCWYVLPHLNAV
jgi:hypothetical protein